jgi:hypothetical protein
MTLQIANTEELMREIISRIDKVFEGEKFTAKEWKPFYRVDMMLRYLPDPQPKHVGKDEAKAIRQLHEDHPSYSIEDLAWIFMRSKSTVHAVLNEKTET